MSLPQNVTTNQQSKPRTPNQVPLSNSEMQEKMKEGRFNPKVEANSAIIKQLEEADFATDIVSLYRQPASILNAGINGVKGYQQSPCTTSTGKMIDGTLDAAFNLLVGSNMATNLLDIVLPKGLSITEMTDSTSSAIASTLEYMVTGNLDSMVGFVEKSEQGQYGKIIAEISE